MASSNAHDNDPPRYLTDSESRGGELQRVEATLRACPGARRVAPPASSRLPLGDVPAFLAAASVRLRQDSAALGYLEPGRRPVTGRRSGRLDRRLRALTDRANRKRGPLRCACDPPGRRRRHTRSHRRMYGHRSDEGRN